MKETRGRPRKFDPEEALANALMVFWTKGYAGTSLDELAQAMNMKRPSIYNAFGNKEALYRAALKAFQSQLNGGLEELSKAKAIKPALNRFFQTAIDVYMTGETPLGCFIFCTAPAETIAHPDVRSDLYAITTEIDRALKRVFSRGQETGQFSAQSDPMIAAQLGQATLHSLAVRARAGQSHASLSKMAKGIVETIFR